AYLKQIKTKNIKLFCRIPLSLAKRTLKAMEQGREKITRQEVEEVRSEEHTSELQSRFDLVCRLLLEKKKNMNNNCIVRDIYFISRTTIMNVIVRDAHIPDAAITMWCATRK